MSEWQVSKSVDALKAGDRFVFSEKFGGDGEIVTATGGASNHMGTRSIGTEELDFDLEFSGPAFVQVVNKDEEIEG